MFLGGIFKIDIHTLRNPYLQQCYWKVRGVCKYVKYNRYLQKFEHAANGYLFFFLSFFFKKKCAVIVRSPYKKHLPKASLYDVQDVTLAVNPHHVMYYVLRLFKSGKNTLLFLLGFVLFVCLCFCCCLFVCLFFVMFF